MVNSSFLQCIIYADDILLCSSSIKGLRDLYDCVIDFTSIHNDILLNPSKSVIIRTGSNKNNPLTFNNIPTKTSAKYLGAFIGDFEQMRPLDLKSLYIADVTALLDRIMMTVSFFRQ